MEKTQYWVSEADIRVRTNRSGVRTATMRNGGNFYLRPGTGKPGQVRVLNYSAASQFGRDTITCRTVEVLCDIATARVAGA